MTKVIFLITLLLLLACERNTDVSGTVDETHTVIALEGHVYNSLGAGASDVSVYIPKTNFSTTTDSSGFYSLKISAGSVNEFPGGIDSIEQKLLFSNQSSLLDSIALDSWVGTMPQVILTQRNISGTIVGDVTHIHKIFMHISLNNNVQVPVELWLNSLTKEYSGFWYTSKLVLSDSVMLNISVVNTHGHVLSESPKLQVGHLAGDIGFPAIVIGSKPNVFELQIKGEFKIGTVLRGEYSYLDSEGDPEEGTQYRWYKNDELIIGASTLEYICQPSDSGAYISFEVVPSASTGFYLVGDPLKVTSNQPVSSTSKPQLTNVLIEGNANQGGTLIGRYEIVAENGELEYLNNYQWYRAGIKNIDGQLFEDGEWELISDATDTIYTIQYADSGKVVHFEVTPVAMTNIGVLDTGQSLASFHFENSVVVTGWNVPDVHNVNISKRGENLIAHYQYSDSDNDLEGETQFQWYRNDTAITDALDSVYVLTKLDTSATIGVTVKPIAATGVNLIGIVRSATLPYFGTVIDERDGWIYRTVIIGGYTWLAENLNYSGNDGEANKEDSIGYCYNAATNTDFQTNSYCDIYGRLYTYYQATGYSEDVDVFIPSPNTPVQGLCLDGWHIALQKEWHDLWYMLEESNETNSALLLSGNLWDHESDTQNLLGFSALPAGVSFNSPDSTLSYSEERNSEYEGQYASWWAGSELVSYTNPITGSWNRWGGHLIFSVTNVFTGFAEYESAGSNKNVGRSIRCVKDHSF